MSASHNMSHVGNMLPTFATKISGLCSTDENWPIQLWNQLTTQSVVTLNLLCTSRIDPTKSAYHQFHGKRYDWNKHPLALPRTRAIIYKDPCTHTSWGPRGTDAWYCGPSLDHYRNCIFYVPQTRAYWVSGSFDLFPQHCMLPDFSPEATHSHITHTDNYPNGYPHNSP